MLEPAPQFARREASVASSAPSSCAACSALARASSASAQVAAHVETGSRGARRRAARRADRYLGCRRRLTRLTSRPLRRVTSCWLSPLAVRQFAQQQRFFEHRQRAIPGRSASTVSKACASSHAHTARCRRYRAPGGAAPPHADSRVDQHQALVAVRHRDARNEAGPQRSIEAARRSTARGSGSRIGAKRRSRRCRSTWRAVEVSMGATVAAPVGSEHERPLSCKMPSVEPKTLKAPAISTVHAAIFASPRWPPELSR